MFTCIIHTITGTKFQINLLTVCNLVFWIRTKKPPPPPPQLTKCQNAVGYRVNLFLQLIYARFYFRVFILRVLSPKPTFLLISAKVSSEIVLLIDARTLLDFGMALSTAVLIAVTIKSAYLSKSLVDRCPEKSRRS